MTLLPPRFRPAGLHHLSLLLPLLACMAIGTSAAGRTVTFDQPQTVGISGFRVMWNESVPLAEDGAIEYTDGVIKDKHPTAVWAPHLRDDKRGALAFDALQRSLLVRFPGAAERIAEQLAEGFEIEKVELVLPFRDAELWPPHGRDGTDPKRGGYTARRNWNVDKMYRGSQPTWHAVAHVLRRPWTAEHAELAPTYNAFINGAGYWTRFGASDEEHDRFAHRFGPTPVNHKQPDGRMDVTAVIRDAAFGESLGQRLRVLGDQGFIVRKWETYDHRFYADSYEWATSTGGRGILIHTPKLVVTFRRGDAVKVTLPPAPDIARLAETLKAEGQGGKPTAVMLSEAELRAFHEKTQQQAPWMTDWMHERVRQLHALKDLGRDPKKPAIQDPLFLDMLLPNYMTYAFYADRRRDETGQMRTHPAGAYRRYEAWVDLILGRQPRGWSGFEAAKQMAQWYEYGEALTGPAQEAIRTYWTAWLMPDRPTADSHAKRMDPNYIEGPLVHPMADILNGKKLAPHEGVHDTYWEKTGDWRGNKSFYRSGFNYTISTQNFNTTAPAGALLGGSIIDADRAIEDGRNGFRSFPLGHWSWANGSSQEHIDHYYYSHTLSGNKAVYDYAPTFYDRMLGRSVMAYNLEELTSAYHPNLRRFIAPASRTTLEHMLVATDGIQFILHTLSKRGTLFDFDKPQHVPDKSSLIGHDVPPEMIAMQTRARPWAPAWTSELIDQKPLPFYAQHQNGDQWRTAYLGEHYGLASVVSAMPRIQVMAHWRRSDQLVDQNTDLGTMDIRYGYNETRFASTAGGHLHRRGSTVVGQHKNRMIVAASPFKLWKNDKQQLGLPGSGQSIDLQSLQTSIVLFNYEQPEPTWTIYIDGKPVEELPARARQGQRIVIHDGVTYIGVIPLEATDLGRDAEVIIAPGTEQISAHGNKPVRSALTINSYNLHREQPVDPAGFDVDQADRAYGGFAIEFGDQSEHGSVEAFIKHLRNADVQQRFNEQNQTFTVDYTSGGQTLSVARPTAHKNETNAVPPGEVTIAVDGKGAFPTGGVRRDTNVSQMVKGGYAEKAGLKVHAEKGPPVYIQHEPRTRTYRVMAPLTRATLMAAELPDGRIIRADGKLRLFDLITRHGDAAIELQTIGRDGSKWDALANVLAIAGAEQKPEVRLNGKPVDVTSTTIDGQRHWIVPLDHGVELPPMDEVASRLATLARFPKMRDMPTLGRMYLQEMMWLGPLPGGESAVDETFGPEQQLLSGEGVDLDATHGGLGDRQVRWQRHRAWDSSMGGYRTHEGLVKDNRYATFRQGDEPMTLYGYTQIVAEASKRVRLNLEIGGVPGHMTVWLNDKRIHHSRYKQLSRDVTLKEGNNELLIRLTQLRPGRQTFKMNIGTETFNLPFVEGVFYRVHDGLIPVNPTPDDPRVEWKQQAHQTVINVRKR